MKLCIKIESEWYLVDMFKRFSVCQNVVLLIVFILQVI